MKNRVYLIGNLGKDAIELNGKAKVFYSFPLGVSSKVGEQKRTDWFDCLSFHELNKSLKKGDRVIVEGQISTGSYKDKEGVERKTFKILCSSVFKIDKQKMVEAVNYAENHSDQPKEDNALFVDEDLPF